MGRLYIAGDFQDKFVHFIIVSLLQMFDKIENSMKSSHFLDVDGTFNFSSIRFVTEEIISQRGRGK